MEDVKARSVEWNFVLLGCPDVIRDDIRIVERQLVILHVASQADLHTLKPETAGQADGLDLRCLP